MPKLTDDQLGDLLRETFADHEPETDSLPKATKRRPLVPVLVAAAAVLAVLVGTVQTVRQSDPEPPAATAAPATNADVWATAIRKIAESHKPVGGWRTLQIYPQVWKIEDNKATPVKPDESMPPPAGRMTFALRQSERDRIGQLVGDLGAVEWTNHTAAGCSRDVAEIAIGPIAHYPDHKSVRVDIHYGCKTFDHLVVDVK
jgi:hypothetical protein